MNVQQDRLSEGIAALKAGKKPEAEQILKDVVKQDPQNADGWLWLGAAVATPNETLYCLERVLEIDPENEKAQAGVKWAATQVAGDEKGAVNPIATLEPDTQGVELSLDSSEVPVPDDRSNFFTNLLIAALALILLLGILLIIALLRAWMG